MIPLWYPRGPKPWIAVEAEESEEGHLDPSSKKTRTIFKVDCYGLQSLQKDGKPDDGGRWSRLHIYRGNLRCSCWNQFPLPWGGLSGWSTDRGQQFSDVGYGAEAAERPQWLIREKRSEYSQKLNSPSATEAANRKARKPSSKKMGDTKSREKADSLRIGVLLCSVWCSRSSIADLGKKRLDREIEIRNYEFWLREKKT